MDASRIAILASLIAVVLLTCPVGGKPQETEPGIFFDDFADGTLDAFGVVPREQEQSNRLPLGF